MGFPIPRVDRKQGMAYVLLAQGFGICRCGEGVLLKYGGDEG